ncbi:hypothetical protein NC651_006193 [Populus alba x Populus x berolinensis]|nr:hypothetical protein NC651_006193 [Populus alba x Populus x berolinensis]
MHREDFGLVWEWSTENVEKRPGSSSSVLWDLD